MYIYIFFIFNRETKHEKLCLNFQPRFSAEANKGKFNYVSRPPPPRIIVSRDTPSKFVPCTQKKLCQIWRFLPVCDAKKSP